jgi:hypothetical protein
VRASVEAAVPIEPAFDVFTDDMASSVASDGRSPDGMRAFAARARA